MFQLTNEQRKCFAIAPTEDDWECIALDRSKYDDYDTYIFVTPDNIVKKMILIGDDRYSEYAYNEMLSPDRRFVLPKTAKGKPQKLSAAVIVKKTRTGMCINYCQGYLSIYNSITEKDFYVSSDAGIKLNGLNDFAKWIKEWCAETREADIDEINRFASEKKQHVKFKEGDFFRVKLGRRTYGYGRILLNYAAFRKNKTPFWDIFMGMPLIVGLYHIATENKNVPIEELDKLKMIPPQMIMDNIFFYGECEIIGNMPVDDSKIDYPVNYGRSINAKEDYIAYQCGRTFIKKPADAELLYKGFINSGIGWRFNTDLMTLLECIKTDSNDPYWAKHEYRIKEDLRHPANKDKLKEIRKSLGIK